jgi:hypothetical protein
MPERTDSKWRLDSLPASSVSNSRSRVITCEVFATESLGRPVARAVSSTLPGASAQRRLLVKGTQTTVRIRLRLRASPWTTNTGLRKPRPEPVGSGRLVQYTWPWAITTRCLQVYVLLQPKRPGRAECLLLRKLGSSPQLQLQDHAARHIRLRLLCKPDSVISSIGGTAARLQRRLYRELRLQFSYPEYNRVFVNLQRLRRTIRRQPQRWST